MFWQPELENQVMIKPDFMVELDKYLSAYLNRISSGEIEILDPNLPTLLHFAIKNNMKSVAQSILKLPGGPQMASMTNQDGLNAREMAVHVGNLDMAKLLKDPELPRQNYEFSVLSQRSNSMQDNNESYYDIPRKFEQCYAVPPPPRPVELQQQPKPCPKKHKYVSMGKSPPKSNSSNQEERPQSAPQPRQELIQSLLDSTCTSAEDLFEPHLYINLDDPGKDSGSIRNDKGT